MSKRNNLMINFDGVQPFQLKAGESFTVPETNTIGTASPIGISSGISPSTLFDTRKPTGGGQIVCGFSDAAGGTANILDYQRKLNPGDVIAIGAVAANKATLTITSAQGVVYETYVLSPGAACTVIGVFGFYG